MKVTSQMNRLFWTVAVRALLPLALLSGAGQAMATLGQAPLTMPVLPPAASAPGARMLATVPTPFSLYTLHETRFENGAIVREYASLSGLVFALTWEGPVLPDLRVLLGGYFNTFKLATDQARLDGRRGSPVNIERDGLVVISNGRMRNFFGHAYAPDLVPAGVAIKDVLP